MTALRIGILGCGRIVRLAHLHALAALPDVQVAGVADPDPEAAAFVARLAPGVPVVGDYRELLDAQALDAVVIAMPPLLHRAAAVAAFERGLHVYLEKPIAPSLADGEAIVSAWRTAGTIGMIGFNLRRNRLYADLGRALANGAAGHPIAVRSAYTALWPDVAPWRVSPEAGGGALLELASHHVDLVRILLRDEIESVQADTWSTRGEDEAAMLQMRLSGGVRAQTLVCYGTVEEDRFELYGASGKLVVDRYNSLAVEQVPTHAVGAMTKVAQHVVREVSAARYGLEKRRDPGQEPSYAAALAAFVAAARTGGGAVAPDLDDGLRALRVIDAARKVAGRREQIH